MTPSPRMIVPRSHHTIAAVTSSSSLPTSASTRALSEAVNSMNNRQLYDEFVGRQIVNRLKVQELRNCLRAFGCAIYGLKADCRNRLETFVSSQVDNSSPERFQWILYTIYRQHHQDHTADLLSKGTAISLTNVTTNSQQTILPIQHIPSRIIVRNPPTLGQSQNRNHTETGMTQNTDQYLPYDPESWAKCLSFVPNFKPSPFYQIIGLAAKPKVIECYGKPICRKFSLSDEHLNLLGFTADVSKASNDDTITVFYSLMLFCFSYSVVQYGEKNHGVAFIEFPHNTNVSINGSSVSVKSTSRPIDVTPYLSLKSGTLQKNNILQMSWACASKKYLAAIYMVYRIPPKTMVNAFINTPKKFCPSLEIREKFITRKLGGNEHISLTTSSISLRCPIAYTKIKTPVRGKYCNHLQTFDLLNYLMLNEQNQTWQCPVCRQKNWMESTGISGRNMISVKRSIDGKAEVEIPVDNDSGLQICGYTKEIIDILEAENRSDVDIVNVGPDGDWSVLDNSGNGEKRKRSSDSDDDSPNEDENDDGVIDIEALSRAQPAVPREIIDLTFETDDERQSDE